MVDLSPTAHRIHVISGIFAALLVFGLLVTYPLYSNEPANQLESIKQNGELRVLTLNAATTYYMGSSGETGFEYQLVKMFADSIGVELKMITVDKYADLYPELIFNSGHLAAAGLSEQDGVSSSNIMFSEPYHEVKQQVLYRRGQHKRPKKLDDLNGGLLEVVDGTSHSQLLGSLQKEYPEMSWRTNKDVATEELIELVEEGLVDYILADSHEIALQRRFYPELRIAFDLGEPKQLRWAVKSSEDKSLLHAIDEFFARIKHDGRLEQLVHRYFSHVAKFNYSDLQTFSIHMKERLPEFEALFRQEAEAHDLDWRLLAAIGYQESLWNPKAKSPTGVRGLMMLTLATAKHVKIKNRLDPAQSIKGGARYFKQVLKKIPKRIQQPDRTWLALASYNVGFGHLEDARKITESQGRDPDKWIDVKEHLPLLGRKKWYSQTKHGYARGWEPVKYVENIRKYYDLLVWNDVKQNGGPQQQLIRTEADQISVPGF